MQKLLEGKNRDARWLGRAATGELLTTKVGLVRRARRVETRARKSANAGRIAEKREEENYCTAGGVFDGEQASRDGLSAMLWWPLHSAFQAGGLKRRSSKPRRLQSCCGSEKLGGIENRDRRVEYSCRGRMGDKNSAGFGAIAMVVER